MTHVDHIKSEIEALSANDFAELRAWIAEKDGQLWEKQIEKDAASGKLDFLREEARVAKAKGKLRDL